jgi:hypothetical protein
MEQQMRTAMGTEIKATATTSEATVAGKPARRTTWANLATVAETLVFTHRRTVFAIISGGLSDADMETIRSSFRLLDGTGR